MGDALFMVRRWRNEFAGAIYHVMSRGDTREGIFDEKRDDARLRDGLAQTVTQYGWEPLTFIFMTNHVHLFLLVELSRLCPPRPAAGLGVVGRFVFGAGRETVIATVADNSGVSPAVFQERRRGDESRDLAAWLRRRLTTDDSSGGRGMANDGGEWQEYLVVKIFFESRWRR
jgi:hypothetical protein